MKKVMALSLGEVILKGKTDIDLLKSWFHP